MTLRHQLTTPYHQLTILRYRLTILRYRLPTLRYQLTILRYQLTILRYWLPILRYRLPTLLRYQSHRSPQQISRWPTICQQVSSFLNYLRVSCYHLLTKRIQIGALCLGAHVPCV